jgi:hypothetical protein
VKASLFVVTLSVALVATYEALLHTLDAKHVASVVLSAGAHTPMWVLVGGGLLLAMRLAIVVLVPGALAAFAAGSLLPLLPRRS